MDVRSFLAAQLWLHPLPPDAWPGGAGDDQAAEANDGHGRIILTGARCCFVLPEGSPGRGRSTDSSTRRRCPLSFSTPSEHRQQRYSCPSPTREEGVLRSGDNRDVWERRSGGGQAQEAADAPSKQFGSRGDRDRDVRGEIVGAGSEAREIRESCSRDTFDFGLAIGVGDTARSVTAKADSGSGARASPAAGGGGAQPAEGTLLLRIQGTVYQAEYPLIGSIAYPKGSSGGVTNNKRDTRGKETGFKVFSAHPNGRAGVEGVQATATAETSFCTGSGGGGDAIEKRNNASHDRTGGSTESSGMGNGIGGNESDDGSITRKGSGTKDIGTLSRHGDDARDGRMSVTTKIGRDSGTGGVMNGVDDTDSDNTCRNEGDQTVAGFAIAGDAPSNLRRNDASPLRNDPGRDPGEVPVPVTRKRKLGASTTNVAEEDASGVDGGDVHRHRDRGVDEAVDNPFCGLLFPGILLKFWLPPRQAAEKFGAIWGRESAVSKLQGVVSDMIEGLTPNTHTHPLARGTAREELDKLARSAMAQARNERFSALVNAWDEFVHGSHLLVLEPLCRKLEEHCHDDEQVVVGVGSSPKNRNAGGVAVGGERCVDRDFPVLSSPPLSAAGVCGETCAVGARGISSFAVGNSAGVSWCFPADGLSAVGRARALTSLADCFSRASLTQPVRSAVREQLQAAETRAATEVEDVLDRAFPLDLSQEADGDSRVSLMSELQASSRRFHLAKEALLPLALLPSADMLYDSDGDPA